jgi:hypothetical protein
MRIPSTLAGNAFVARSALDGHLRAVRPVAPAISKGPGWCIGLAAADAGSPAKGSIGRITTIASLSIQGLNFHPVEVVGSSN